METCRIMHVCTWLGTTTIYMHSVQSRRWLNGAAGNEREQVDVALGRSKCRDLGG